MSVTSRLQQAWRGLRTSDMPAQSEAQPERVMARTPGQTLRLWPDYRNERPLWTANDIQSFIDSGYTLNAVIHAAISYRADAVNSAQLRAYRGDQDQSMLLPDTDPLAMLLAQPNPFQCEYEFHAANSVFYALAGQSFVWLWRDKVNGIPAAMYTLRPDWVHIVPKDKMVIGYIYAPEGVALRDGYAILPEDMIHVKRPNPGDPLMGAGYGLSPMNALAQSANVDNDVTKFLKVFFQSGAMFQNVISFEGSHDSDDLARIREQLKERYGGVGNWNEWAVFDSSAKVTRISPTFDEMGFDAIDSRDEARMLMALGVPPILVGARLGLERSTYSNYEEARRAFWEDRMLPELKTFGSKYKGKLSFNGSFVRYDLSDVPALRRDIPALSTAAKTLYDMGVPARVAFTAVGLEVPEYEGDQDSKPAAVNPFAGLTAPAQPEDETPTQPAEGEALEGTASKTRVTKAYDAATMQRKMDTLAVNWEQRFGAQTVRVFDQEQRELSALLNGMQKAAYARKASPDWRSLMGTVADWYAKTQPEAWRSAFVPLLEGVMLDAGKEWASALGIQFDVRNLRAESWFQEYALKFAQPITQTSSDTVKAVLEQALAEGWSIQDTDKRLGQVFDQWTKGDLSAEDFAWFEQRMPPYRRELIARVESMRSANAGSNTLFKEWGVKEREWIATTGDDRTRDTHLEANGQRQPMDEPFMVGGYPMMYPLDMDLGAPPEEAMNCRCTVGAIVD